MTGQAVRSRRRETVTTPTTYRPRYRWKAHRVSEEVPQWLEAYVSRSRSACWPRWSSEPEQSSPTAAAGKILDTRLVGVPNPPVTVVGVNGAGAAWTTDDSRAKLFADGRLDLDIEGLVFLSGANAGRNTVPQGRATVVCNGNANPATDRVNSDPIPFSIPDGNAEFNGRLNLPSPCFAPIIFFTSVSGNWFAVSG